MGLVYAYETLGIIVNNMSFALHERTSSKKLYTSQKLRKIVQSATAFSCVFFQIWFEGIPKRAKDPSRRFRGYVALDDIVFDKMEEAGDNCLGHCTFEGGFCGWTNADTGLLLFLYLTD